MRERNKKAEKIKARLERTQKSKKFIKNEWKKWHKKAWDVQSKYFRMSQANFQDLVECYTCFTLVPWKESQLGHFHHNKADFEARNLHVQCVRCNHHLSGNLASYATRLVQEIGQEGMMELQRVANTKIYSLEDLKQIFAKYKALLEAFVK